MNEVFAARTTTHNKRIKFCLSHDDTPVSPCLLGIKKTNSYFFFYFIQERSASVRRSLLLARHLLAPLKDRRTADAGNLILRSARPQTDYSAVLRGLASALTFMFFNVSLALTAPPVYVLRFFNHTLSGSSHLSRRTLSHPDDIFQN